MTHKIKHKSGSDTLIRYKNTLIIVVKFLVRA